jgi:hypothetical protein
LHSTFPHSSLEELPPPIVPESNHPTTERHHSKQNTFFQDTYI